MRKAIGSIWAYFVDMNSEKGGGVSIKRNMAWGFGTLVVVVQCYSMYEFPKDKVLEFANLCKFYAIADILFILLVLGITTFEKLSDLVQRIKGGIFSGNVSVQENKEVTTTKEVNT